MTYRTLTETEITVFSLKIKCIQILKSQGRKKEPSLSVALTVHLPNCYEVARLLSHMQISTANMHTARKMIMLSIGSKFFPMHDYVNNMHLEIFY